MSREDSIILSFPINLSFPRSGVGMQLGTLRRPVPLERYSGIPIYAPEGAPERGNDAVDSAATR